MLRQICVSQSEMGAFVDPNDETHREIEMHLVHVINIPRYRISFSILIDEKENDAVVQLFTF